jgi:hypothetical protein
MVVYLIKQQTYRKEGEIRVHNKIKSIVIGGKRKPGRPFNTTTYPWRSVAIGRSFHLNPGAKPGMQMLYRLKAEGRDFKFSETKYGYKATRIA